MKDGIAEDGVLVLFAFDVDDEEDSFRDTVRVGVADCCFGAAS